MTQPASNIVPLPVPLVTSDRLYSDLFEVQQASNYRLALMLCGGPHVAEEIVAEVFAHRRVAAAVGPPSGGDRVSVPR